MKNTVFILLAAVTLFAGCNAGPQQNATLGMGAAGAIGGGLIGNAIKKGDAKTIALGTGAGLLVGGLAGNYFSSGVQGAFDEGYVRGQSDNIKRTYWILQNSQVGDTRSKEQGRTVYYTMPGPVETEDGRKLVEHTVTVPVVE